MKRTTRNLINEMAGKILPHDTRAYQFALMAFFYMTHKARLKPKKTLSIEIPLAGHCNLNCVHCGAFAPVSKKEFLNYSIFERDIARLAAIDRNHHLVKTIIFTGGEPLLNPEITKFINLANLYFPAGAITIQTNGLLLDKMPKKFWTACKYNHVHFALTNYPTPKMPDMAAIIKKMNDNGIQFNFFGGKIKTMYKIPLDVNGGHNDFKICLWADRNARLKNGNIYGCGVRAYADKLNEYFNVDFKVSDADRLNLYEISGTGEIANFIAKPTPFCQYCAFKKATYGVPWRESAKKLKEWVL